MTNSAVFVGLYLCVDNMMESHIQSCRVKYVFLTRNKMLQVNLERQRTATNTWFLLCSLLYWWFLKYTVVKNVEIGGKHFMWKCCYRTMKIKLVVLTWMKERERKWLGTPLWVVTSLKFTCSLSPRIAVVTHYTCSQYELSSVWANTSLPVDS